jgi:hypothetical protein
MLHENTTFAKDELRYHAIDFEATGLTFDADPTSVVIHHGVSATALLRENDDHAADTDALAGALTEMAGVPVSVEMSETVEGFLTDLQGILTETVVRDARDVLVFFNGNPTGRQKGYDVPLIRHATLRTPGSPFPLMGFKYADLMDATGYGEVYVREDTVTESALDKSTYKGDVVALCNDHAIEPNGGTNKPDYVTAAVENIEAEEIRAYAEENFDKSLSYPVDNSQENLYERFGGAPLDYDGFEDSSEAITAWENGDYKALLAHNLADVVMTNFLTERLLDVCAFPRVRRLN